MPEQVVNEGSELAETVHCSACISSSAHLAAFIWKRLVCGLRKPPQQSVARSSIIFGSR